MRKGSAGSARGVVRFIDELVARLRRSGADGQITLRADSGFWSWKLVDTLNRHGVLWSITVTGHKAIRAAIAQIPEAAWVDIDYTIGGRALRTPPEMLSPPTSSTATTRSSSWRSAI